MQGKPGSIPLAQEGGLGSSLDSANELAAAAELVMGKTERLPVVLIRGYRYVRGEGHASMLLRAPERDLFR